MGLILPPTGPGVAGNYAQGQRPATKRNSNMGRILCSDGIAACDSDGIMARRDRALFALSPNNQFRLHYYRYAAFGAAGVQPDQMQPVGAEPVNQLDLIYHYSRSNGVCMSVGCNLELDWDAADDSPHKPWLGRIDHKINHGGMLSGSRAAGDNIFGYTCQACGRGGVLSS
jgi:hypothetical protein